MTDKETKKLKIVVTGYARHGKDTVCEMLEKQGWTFKSSSDILCEEVVFPVLRKKYGYTSAEECFEDRYTKRPEWFDLLRAYNTPDAARLGKLIFSKYDIYCGLRNKDELIALQELGLVDLVIWVDAWPRVSTVEGTESMTISADDADFVVDNSGTLEDLEYNVAHLQTLLEHNMRYG